LSAPVAASPLVRLLGEWFPTDARASGMDFAERLSLWLGAVDAIGLQATHQAVRATRSAAPGPLTTRGAAPLSPAEDLQRVRSMLAHAISQPIARPPEGRPEYKPYADRHVDLQRQMELAIPPLRAHVREVASAQSARLRQLSTLDAAMEQMLAARGQALLAKLPARLKRRFEQLHASAAGDTDQDWLQAFDREWRQALLAELEVRLAPVTGLVEAAADEGNETR
jgi:hypothetical protein